MRRRRRIHNRIICAFLVLSIALSASPGPAMADTKSKLNREKDNAEKQLEAANENVSSIEEGRSEAAAEVEEVDHQLVQLLATIDILDDEIAVKKVDVEESTEAYKAAKAEEDSQYSTMKKRIRFMYERGDTQYIEILMRAEGFADAINKADYVEKVYDYDRELLKRYDAAVKEARALHDRLVEEEAELEGMQLEFKEQQAELEKTLTEKKAVVENFDEKLSIARAEAKKFENQVKEINTQIARAAAKEKAEREAREKAEREAREKAARESSSKKKKADDQEGEYKEDKKSSESSSVKGGDESSQEGDYKDEEGNYDESSQEGEYKDDSTSSSSPSGGGGAVVTGGGTGADIANYACKFIGNPYVLGGTSLTNGCDCSGFTFSVYAHFGYKIPRTSSEQQSCGRGVSYSEAQAGDIICYAGHVGLYIGNGMIVHASTPATGIKTTVATYRPILAVRRVV